jgi:hypothetical protein
LLFNFTLHIRLAAVGSKPLDCNIRFADEKEAPILGPFCAVSAPLAGEKNGVEDHNGSGGLMQGAHQCCVAGHARPVEWRQKEWNGDKAKRKQMGRRR